MNFKEYDFDEVETLFDSKPSIEIYNDSDHIFYSRYGATHSDIYAIPIVEEQRNVFGYSGSIFNCHAVLAPDERTSLMRMNLSPYRKKLDKEPIIRYLYTGREYNVEIGDYYYRARMMDASVGRFGSKDYYLFLNRYNYVGNEPLYWVDPSGEWVLIPVLSAIGAAAGAMGAKLAGGSKEDIIKGAMAGAIAGAVAGATAGLGTIISAALGAGAGVVTTGILYSESSSIGGSIPVNPLFGRPNICY